MAGEADAAWDRGVLKTDLLPLNKDVTGGEDGGRGDESFEQVGAVITGLEIRRAILEREQQETPSSNAVVEGGGIAF